MLDNDLKKLNRKQLLELLLKQTERADELEKKLNAANKKLRDRTLSETEAGTMAEAALKLNRVFEAADSAAEQYLENIKQMQERCDAECRRIEEESREKAERMFSESAKLCAEREAAAERKYRLAAEKLEELNSQKGAEVSEYNE